MARMAAEAAVKKLVGWIGGGVLLLILLFVVLIAAIVSFSSGGFLTGGLTGATGNPPIGTALSRPLEWLGYPAIAQAGLPNTVVMAVIQRQSSGRILDGLMGARYGRNPAQNLPAGARALGADFAGAGGFLKAALTNFGVSPGAVKGDVADYEAGPAISVWATADWTHGQWTVTAHQRVWLIVVAAGPYGGKYVVKWRPRKPKCTTNPQGQTVCKKQPLHYLRGRTLVLPRSVTANGQALALNPAGLPIWPGAQAWGAHVRGPGTYRIVATWPGGQTATASITLVPGR